jgi:3-dehydroquinate synthase
LERIVVNTPGATSEIFIGRSWESVKTLLPDTGVIIVTDDNVQDLYGKRFPGFPVINITPGEASKSLGTIQSLAEKLLLSGVDRSGFILAIGGGVVCDIAGFLSSIYMRGIRCGYVSSSLLAQVDASTGGKNGVNLGGTKNILGIIRQPEFVICDTNMLLTLPEQEYLSGLAELIKTAIIGDKDLFDLIESSYSEIMNRDVDLLNILVSRSVRFKAKIVSEDERESGIRRILNFGHTFGHAVEMQKAVKHGFAVASGMELAAELSFAKGLISISEKERIITLLRKFGLIEKHDLKDDQIEQLVLHDKKKTGSDIHFVFTDGIGSALVRKVATSELIDFYKRFRDKN